MPKLVTIYGGSGFVGRYIAQKMAQEGWRVRVAVRRPNEAMQVKPYGVVGQVEPVFCNIRDDESVRSAMLGANAVVNCVGILDENGPNKFAAIQHEGAKRVAQIASEQKVQQLVHLSSIGADANSESKYSKSKALGEAAVLKEFPSAIILRPSVIFGPEDRFFNKFAKMSGLGPVLPIVAGQSKMQPVYVDDVAKAAALGARGLAKGGVYELGGPGVYTLNELMEIMLGVIKRKRLILNLPTFIGSIIATMMDAVQAVSIGLVRNSVLTRDQLKNLQYDNVVSSDAKGFADLGLEPVSLLSVLPDYLWPYRPSGQFSAIKASAKNLQS